MGANSVAAGASAAAAGVAVASASAGCEPLGATAGAQADKTRLAITSKAGQPRLRE